jgi:hypothetical protein
MRLRILCPGQDRASRTLSGAIGLALAGIFAAGTPATSAAQVNPYNSIGLQWTAPGDDGNVGQVSSYQLAYSTTPVGPDTTSWWNASSTQKVTLGPPLAPAGAQDSTRVSGLTAGTTYYFIIRALDEVPNISGYSNVVVATTYSCNAPTSPPGQFSAVADTGQVLVSWASTSDPQAVSLNLYRAQGTSGAWVLFRNLPLSSTSFLDTGVAAGTTYRYRAAWMGSACEGPVTAAVTVTTPGVPQPPPVVGPSGSTIHAYPNPSDGAVQLVIDVTASTTQHVDVRLYDMNGHVIATLVEGDYPPGQTQVTWARTNRDGQRVAPGYYEALGTIGSAHVRERLVLLP